MNLSNVQQALEEIMQKPMKYNKRVILIRHAQSVGNLKAEIHGLTDYPLTEVGKLQSKLMGSVLKNNLSQVREIKTSNLTRCMQTCGLSVGIQNGEIQPEMQIKKINLNIKEEQVDLIEEKLVDQKRFVFSNDFQKIGLKQKIVAKLALEIEKEINGENMELKIENENHDSNKEEKEINNEEIKLKEDIIKILKSKNESDENLKKKTNIIFNIDTRIQERNMGILENIEISKKIYRNGKISKFWQIYNKGVIKPYGAEEPKRFRYRFIESLNNTQDGISLFFTHGGILYTIFRFFEKEKKMFLGNCSFLVLNFDKFEEKTELSVIFEGFK